jgi:hypothetical protein
MTALMKRANGSPPPPVRTRTSRASIVHIASPEQHPRITATRRDSTWRSVPPSGNLAPYRELCPDVSPRLSTAILMPCGTGPRAPTFAPGDRRARPKQTERSSQITPHKRARVRQSTCPRIWPLLVPLAVHIRPSGKRRCSARVVNSCSGQGASCDINWRHAAIR